MLNAVHGLGTLLYHFFFTTPPIYLDPLCAVGTAYRVLDYWNYSMCTKPENRAQTLVRKIELWRETLNPRQHDYLVATVQTMDPKVRLYLLAEREPSGDSAAEGIPPMPPGTIGRTSVVGEVVVRTFDAAGLQQLQQHRQTRLVEAFTPPQRLCVCEWAKILYTTSRDNPNRINSPGARTYADMALYTVKRFFGQRAGAGRWSFLGVSREGALSYNGVCLVPPAARMRLINHCRLCSDKQVILSPEVCAGYMFYKQLQQPVVYLYANSSPPNVVHFIQWG